MADEKTRTLWDHITGEAFEGELAGQMLDVWPISLTTVAAALAKFSDIEIFLSHYKHPLSWFFRLTQRNKINGSSFLPPRFRQSMSQEIDPRLPEMTQGLGVTAGYRGKFYPLQAIPKGSYIDDVWQKRPLRIERSELDGVPFARWQDSGEPPMQLLSRWYGFSFTYPKCDIYE